MLPVLCVHPGDAESHMDKCSSCAQGALSVLLYSQVRSTHTQCVFAQLCMQDVCVLNELVSELGQCYET